jgi:hypothetical protein
LRRSLSTTLDIYLVYGDDRKSCPPKTTVNKDEMDLLQTFVDAPFKVRGGKAGFMMRINDISRRRDFKLCVSFRQGGVAYQVRGEKEEREKERERRKNRKREARR